MTRHALVLLCLVALSATASLAAVPTVYKKVGDNLELGPVEEDHQYDIATCEVTMNNGTRLVLYPLKDNERYERFVIYSYEKCRTNIYKMTSKDSGKWEIQTTIHNVTLPKVYPYEVKIRKMFQEKVAVPASRAWVYPEQQVSVSFNERFDNIESCKLLNPNQIEYDLGSDKSAHIKLTGHCGFKMTVQKEYAGEWTLIADLKNDTAFYAKFDVLVKDKKELKLNQTDLYFKRGEKKVYVSGGRQVEKAKMCIMEDPHGVKYPIHTGACNHEIDTVTEHHEGVWKAYYGFDGIERLVQQNITVHTYDISPLNSTVISSPNGDQVNLLCQVRSRTMKFCSFIRPDGEMLHMTIAVGNDKYEYYGKGVHEQERYVTGSDALYDCGVTIHKPSKEDYGSWRCLIRISSTETLGTVLKVTGPSSRSTNAVAKKVVKADDVYVKRGESFKIKCSADEVLSYCWLRSPNGSVHTVMSGQPELPALNYKGTGLELGDCTAFIPVANETDNGKWTCHMGVANGPELETSLDVILKDTHLMAVHQVVVFDSSEETLFSCRPLPESNKVIEACRWVNPKGHGINVDPDGRYVTETGTTHCNLSIRVIDFEEDVGKWSCFARFSDNHEEGSASMVLTYKSGGIGSFLTIALSISLLVCTSVGIFVFIVYKRRVSIAQPDEKVILEKPQKYP